MNTRKRNLFGLGVLAGAAIGYWLNTEQGKAVRRQATGKANELGQVAAEYIKENAEQLKQTATSTLEQGQNIANKLATQAKDTINNAADTAEDRLDTANHSLQNGISKARRKIETETEKLQNASIA